MANLDRFSQHFSFESFELDLEREENDSCNCSECYEDIVKTDKKYKWEYEVFCSKECVVKWVFENEIVVEGE